jgi:hypothetical protein
MALGQIVGGIAQIAGARQMKRTAQEMLAKGGEWQDYQISEQANQMLGEAQARRGAQMPGMGLAQAQMAQQQAGALSALQRGATGGANYLALAAAINAQGGQQVQNLAGQQAQFNEMQQQQLNQARANMMQQEQMRFQNQLGRFQYYNQMGNQLREAARAQSIQGFSNLGQGVENAATFIASGGLKPNTGVDTGSVSRLRTTFGS